MSAPASRGPAVSAPASSGPAVSAPASSEPPDPCLAPIVPAASMAAVFEPDLSSLRICDPGGFPKALGRNRPVVLSGDDAVSIAKILFLAPAPAGTANCAQTPDALLRFGHSDGTEADVEVYSIGCEQPTVSVGAQVWLIDSTLASFLSGDAIAPGLPGNPVPDVTGLSFAEAASTITHAGLTIRSGGRVTDPLLSTDTVVLQNPPSGTGDIGGEVDVLLSQQPAPECIASELAVDDRGVGHGTGDAFGNFDIRDIGANACTLTGPVSIVGLNDTGHPVTNRQTFAVSRDLVLTAMTALLAAGDYPPPDASIAALTIEADVRDGPDADGSCSGHLVTPATWAVTLAGGTKVVRNGSGTDETTMSACQGQLFGQQPLTPITVIE